MPKENPLSPTLDPQTLQELFAETDAWIADLHFRSEELRFYWKVTGHYLKSIDRETTDRVEQVQKSLSRLDNHNENLLSEVLRYREHLDQQMKDFHLPDDKSLDEKVMRERHEAVQKKIHMLDRECRNFKDDVFDIAEDVFGD